MLHNVIFSVYICSNCHANELAMRCNSSNVINVQFKIKLSNFLYLWSLSHYRWHSLFFSCFVEFLLSPLTLHIVPLCAFRGHQKYFKISRNFVDHRLFQGSLSKLAITVSHPIISGIVQLPLHYII